MLHSGRTRSLVSAWLLLLALSAHIAMAQPTTSAGVAPVAPTATASQMPPYPALQVPKQIELKLTGIPVPSSGPGWMGSLVIGAILAALSSIATTFIGAEERRKLETALQSSRLLHESELAKRNLEHEQSTQNNILSREDQKIETERRRLKQQTDASDLEIEIAATRMVREHEAEAAKLIHLFFDRLTSEQAIHRELALQALSGSVDVDAIRATLNSAHQVATLPSPSNPKDGSDQTKIQI